MGYYRAVQLSNSVNSTIIRDTLKNMEMFETFAFPLKFLDNGTNQFPQCIPIQYVDGEGHPVDTSNLVYPADWKVKSMFHFIFNFEGGGRGVWSHLAYV